MKTHSPERWRQIDEIFAEALERPVAERDAILRERCGADAELRAEVSGPSLEAG